MITDSVKQKIGMGWEPLGHFYIDREIVPALDSFRAKVPSGRIAKISNGLGTGPQQICIIGLPSLFKPDAEFIQILATIAFYMFEFRLDRDCVSFRFAGTLKEYVEDGVFDCRWATDGGTFGGAFKCSDLKISLTNDRKTRTVRIVYRLKKLCRNL